MNFLRRTWADINLDNLEYNYHSIRNHVGIGPKFLGVMKADAYGHGAVPLSRRLVELGADYLAVCNIEEAFQIRRGGVAAPVLILGYTPASYAETMVLMNITQEVHSLEYAKELDEQLVGTNHKLRVHLKIDTGMTRLGFLAEDPALACQLEKVAGLQHLYIEGAFMHFSCSDSLQADDVAYTRMQHKRFLSALELMSSLGIHPEIRHCCNSGATVLHPEFAMDMVRPGILIYGAHPSEDTKPHLPLRPVMTFCSSVSQLRDIPAGSQISYGRTFTAQRDIRMAVVPVGYADGLSRSYSSCGTFFIHGKEVPILGRICMDMCMVDVTDVPEVKVGDVVTIFGEYDGVTYPCDRIANRLGTISYEVFCDVNKRVPRVYHTDEKATELL